MHTKISRFLLPVLALALLKIAYSLFEPYILKLLSISKENIQATYMLQFLLLLPTLAAVASITWASDLQTKIKLLQLKKEEDIAEWRTEITPADLERIDKLLNKDKEEIELLKKELLVHKKYLVQYAPAGFDIDQAEEYEKGWNDAG